MSVTASSPPTPAALGCAIRRIRRHRRLSIETLALAASVHPTYLSGIERGQRNPTWLVVASLATALDLSVVALAHETVAESHLAERMRAARAELGMSA
jgi:transcriptional regulator with XRE-family HTH domain